MAQQSPAVSYEKIDQELMKQPKDLVKVEQMLKSLNPALDDPEILWRLGSIHYYKSLEFDNEDEVKSRTLESFKFVQKAAKCFEAKSIDHFESNKWCAIVNGKLALLEIDPNDKVKYIENFLKYNEKCVRKSPNDDMVLFMYGRFQLALSLLSEEEETIIRQKFPQMPKSDMAGAKIKLKKSIELNPNFLDCYITLAYLLMKTNQLNEAYQIVVQGLKLPTFNKSDEIIHNELIKIKDTLFKVSNNKKDTC